MEVKKIFYYYILNIENENTFNEINDTYYSNSNSFKDSREWILLLSAIKFSKEKNIIDKKRILNYDEMKNKIKKSEKPDFIINENIGLEVFQLILDENMVRAKKSRNIIPDHENKYKFGYMGADNINLEKAVSKYIKLIDKKIKIWQNYNSKFKVNILLIDLHMATIIRAINLENYFEHKFKIYCKNLNIKILELNINNNFILIKK